MRQGLGFVMAALVTWVGGTAAASAQSLGTFSWGLAPYCNVITVTVTQNGSNYTLDGYDNQCGGSTRAAVVGMAVPNPSGTVTLGFAIVTPPNGTPVHVTTVIDLGSLGGSWSDDQGNTGTFVFTPSGTGSGSPRPAALNGLADDTVTSAKIVDGAVGGADVNAAEVQKRVSSTCPSGQLMTGVTESGGVSCEAVSSTSGGDITAVNAGDGLLGGGATGAVTLSIADGGVNSIHLAQNSVTSVTVRDGTIGAADINQMQVQARVTGTCPAGQAMRTVTQTGAVTCEPVAGGAGDITAVIAGAGLSGGATTGDATLSVAYGGTGAVNLAARSDHTHAGSSVTNTAVGSGALGAVTSGDGNTAVGRLALSATTTGGNNTAAGWFALESNTTGTDNTAFGTSALRGGTASTANVAVGVRAGFNGGSGNTLLGFEAGFDTGTAGTVGNTAVGHRALFDANDDNNTAVGHNALDSLDIGEDNVAIGQGAGQNITAGSRNILIGARGGVNLTGGSDNVYLGSNGVVGDSGTMRLGRLQTSRAFVAGVSGVTTGVNNAVNVVIDSNGQLGTASSSRKTKFDIADLEMSVTSALQRLRPVQFRYLKPFADGSTPIQYGLIAEEVEQVLPELVAYDQQGEPMTVKYHVLPSLLLAEVQRLSREVASLQSELAALVAARR